MAILSGSCSAVTRAQIAHYGDAHPTYRLDVRRLAAGDDVVADALDFSLHRMSEIPLIHSSVDLDGVRNIQEELGVARSAELIESAFARLTSHLVDHGVRRLIVAGGETSGAVVRALGVTAVEVGEEVDPGVPWTVSLDEPHVGLLLKSGNFGGSHFFIKASEDAS